MRHVFFTREFSGLNHFNNHGYHTWLRSVILLILRFNNKISCRRAAATICPRPDLQQKHETAAQSQAAESGPISQHAPCSRPAVRDRRQTASSLNACGWGHKNTRYKLTIWYLNYSICLAEDRNLVSRPVFSHN